jgi:predicted TIM-barrel fold metal-dependent hydrolase
MNINPSDPALVPFYQKLVELHLPLLIHVGREQTFVNARDELCDPIHLKVPLDLGVKVIAAHLATTGENNGESDYARLRKLFEVEKYKGLLFADISATTQHNRIKSINDWIHDPLFQDRLLNGTDWPLIDVEAFGIKLTSYRLYSSKLFGHILTKKEVAELDLIPNSFDRDTRIKEFLGASEDLFRRAESVLQLK